MDKDFNCNSFLIIVIMGMVIKDIIVIVGNFLIMDTINLVINNLVVNFSCTYQIFMIIF